ncbi:uncharacterized protein PHACADRAFT_249939 [Phanerochaete carnosa HHB-10118-sp]|uniref:Uncharacterized protein n=1 Tax=Phanerochaete carnosa (strain HHB-10118-sp) TaxID=650164 RepID=K5W699_PHACS|nr:uncharacterized protein PHACADRAFT_249939 [Phanerochaete carnosa HHB-10118-sp]EKM59443.1 hypothetical protein PHACADRAFT_249939 [Phanerochaete carnosa HHB-10118-sp]
MAASKVAAALKQLLPAELPPSLQSRSGSLYSVLSRYPKDGVGQHVHQIRWNTKGIADSYWLITRTKLKLEGQHGKVWGKLVWRGKTINIREVRIPGGLKYDWKQGASRGKPQGTQAAATTLS